MASESWESLNTDLTTRLSGLVTDITLHVKMMLATGNRILKDAHMEEFLDSLATAISVSCGSLLSFSINIATSRYFVEEESVGFIEEEHTIEE